MSLFVQLAFVLATLGCIQAFMVFAPKGTCKYKKAYGIFNMIKKQCQAMGGSWNGNPEVYSWIQCHMDMCKVPQSGAVSNKWVWVIDAEQNDMTTGSSRMYATIPLQRKECDALQGRYNGSPRYNDWTMCHLYMKRVDGTDRKNIDGIVFCGVGECANKVAYGIIYMKNRDCSFIKGKWNGNPGANDWIDCHLDLALSPVIKCVPSDSWAPIQKCVNDHSDVSLMCKYTKTTGVKKGSTVSGTTGGNTEISNKVGAELKGLFTSSVSTTFKTGFNWSQTKSDSRLWSQSTSQSFAVTVPPGKNVVISQVVGKCNEFYVNTPEFRVTED